MVTRTIADSERFSIDFSFCKQRRVNFVGFFDSLCLSFIAEQRKRKRNSKKPNAHSQFLFILIYIISQFTKQTIAGIIFSLTESHICLPFSKKYWKKIFLSKHLGFSPGSEASNAGCKCAQNEAQPLPEKPTPVLTLHFKVINQHLGTLPGGGIKYRRWNAQNESLWNLAM